MKKNIFTIFFKIITVSSLLFPWAALAQASSNGVSVTVSNITGTTAKVSLSIAGSAIEAMRDYSQTSSVNFHVSYGRTKGFLVKKTANCTVDLSVPVGTASTKTCAFSVTGLSVGKKYYYKVNGDLIISPATTGDFTTSKELPHVNSLLVTQTATEITPAFQFEGIPSQNIELYAWIGKGDGTWIKRDKLLATVNKGTTVVTKDFNVVFNYADLGLENGKQYAYLIADGTGNNAKLYTPMGFFTVGSIITGGPVCTESSSCIDPVSLELQLPVITDTSLTVRGTLYANEFPVPNGKLTIATGPSAGTLGVDVPVYEGDIPLTGIGFSKTLSGFTPGASYLFHLKEQTTGTDFGNQIFTMAAATSPTTSSTTSAPKIEIAGVTITFDGTKQVVEKDKAKIVGTVSVNLPIAVELSYLSSAAGSPLGNEQLLLTQKMLPGITEQITMEFTGLEAGKTYQFAIKNKVTNTLSKPFIFTTPGGITNETALFNGNRVGGMGTAGSFTEMTDTISDKGIVPRCGLTKGSGITAEEEKMCGYADFLQLISNIVTYGLILIGPIVAIMAMYSGAMIIILGKNPDPTGELMKQLANHKARLVKIAIGIAIILMSYVIITTILRELGVKKEYQLLDVISSS